ncbi:MAG: agmatinase [Pseudomonadota bacterium]
MNSFQRFLASGSAVEEADIVLLGVPFDGTACFRPGARFGPGSIRFWSDVLETYSRPFDKDLTEIHLADAGDLPVLSADWTDASRKIRTAVDEVLVRGAVPILMGGEHLVSLPAVEACASRFPGLAVIHLDAHMDLRDDYEGLKFSHATVMRRIVESAEPGRLLQYGVRSGTREEWVWSCQRGTVVDDMDALAELTGVDPVYLTIDLDVLDPSVMPETGTPEPGGMTFKELHAVLLALRGKKVVGGDVVEYCPLPGNGGTSGAVAAKVVRELIFLIADARGR